MNYVIVTGHGEYASGIKNCLEAIAGEQEQFYFIDYDTNDSCESLKAQYKELKQKDNTGNYLFVCDVVGATPYQMAALLAVEDSSIQVVGGVNVSALLEIIFHLNEDIGALAEKMIEITKRTTILFKRRKRL